MKILIGTTEYKVLKNQTKIEDAIGERSVASFTVIDLSSEFAFSKGRPVTIYDGETVIYKGFINSINENRQGVELYHSIEAIDNHYLAGKRMIAKAYASEYAGNIVKDFISDKLSGEGVTEGTIETGPVITEAVFNYVPCSDAIAELADKTGYWWKIDQDRKLHFRAPASVPAPFEITNKDMIRKPRYTVENDQYRNTQIIRGSKDITEVQTESKIGDGVNTTFTVGYPLAKVPTITLNNAPQTVGIKGLDANKNWYWNKGDPVISQDKSGTILTSSDTLKIEYQGEYEIIVYINDLAEIAGRSETEGTSGIVEDVEDQPNLTTLEAAFEVANKRLEQNVGVNSTIEFETYKAGLESGQMLSVTVPYHKLNSEQMLITKVVKARDGFRFLYSITAVKGAAHKSWQSLFYKMATKPEDLLIRKGIQENQILITVEDFSRTWGASDVPNIFKEVYASTSVFPSTSLYPMFKPEERVRYIAWYNGTTELGRKQITKSVVTTGQIDTITYLASYDANETITHIGWIGGWRATTAVGTGVVADKQVFAKTKTQLESIQVNKKDIRNFTPSTGTFALTAEYMQGIDDQITILQERSV